MSEIEPPEDRAMEDLLRRVALVGPSRRLDARLDDVLAARPGYWRWLGPALGFAAGVAMTVGIGRALPRSVDAPAREQPTVTGKAPPRAGGAEEVRTVVGIPSREVERIDGEIGGVPVRLERTRQSIQVLPSNVAPGGMLVQLPDEYVIRRVDGY